MASSRWTDYSLPDPQFEAFLSDLGPLPGIDVSSIPISVIRSMQPTRDDVANMSIGMQNVKKSRIAIPTRDGSTIPALLYQPEKTPQSGSPLFAMYHGGGWCMGTPESEEVNCINAVKSFGAVCLSVDYRLAPEHPFPIPVYDSWDALKWIATNSHILEADPTQGFIVHGESAGGNFAAVLALLARDEGLTPPITGVSLSIPALLSPEVVPDKYQAEYLSYVQNKDAPGLNSKALKYLVDNYNPDRLSPLFNCFNWPSGHKGLPPVSFLICGMDPLRDEGLLYEQLLRTEYGVKTKLTVYRGLPHAFWALFPEFSKSALAFEDTAAGFKWLLHKGAEDHQ